MKVVDPPVASIWPAHWNPNQMNEAMLARLRRSIELAGMIFRLVVRLVGNGVYEIIGGEQRFNVPHEMGAATAPCVIVTADHAKARLLAQALNNIVGTEDLGLRAGTHRSILESVPQEEVLTLLPETAASLGELASLGEEDLSRHLQACNLAQSARLKHLTFHLAADQLAVVNRALERSMTDA